MFHHRSHFSSIFLRFVIKPTCIAFSFNLYFSIDGVSSLTTADGSEYGLHHVTNIWHGTKLGFNADDPYFASIIGKTITQITFYAADGVYVLPVNVAL